MRKKRRAAAADAASTAPLHPAAPNVLLWLRHDLRLHDNPALVAAAREARAAGGTLTFVYVHSPEEDGDDFRTGAAREAASAGGCLGKDQFWAVQKSF